MIQVNMTSGSLRSLLQSVGPGLSPNVRGVVGQLLVVMVGRTLLCHNVFRLKQFIYNIQLDNINFNLQLVAPK